MTDKNTAERQIRAHKRRAKKMVRNGVGTYMVCLNIIAREEGHKDWWSLSQAIRGNGTAGPTRVRFGIDSKHSDGTRLTYPGSGFRAVWDFEPDGDVFDEDGEIEFDDLRYFEFVGTPPCTVDDAVRRIRKFTFHPPERLFFDNEELEPYPHVIAPGVRGVGGELSKRKTDWRQAPKPCSEDYVRVAFADNDDEGTEPAPFLIDEGYTPTMADAAEAMLQAAAASGQQFNSNEELRRWCQEKLQSTEMQAMMRHDAGQRDSKG